MSMQTLPEHQRRVSRIPRATRSVDLILPPQILSDKAKNALVYESFIGLSLLDFVDRINELSGPHGWKLSVIDNGQTMKAVKYDE